MKNLKFNVCGQTIIPAFTEKIIADSKNYFIMSFEFSEEWNGFIKTAVITVNDTVYNCIINNEGIITSENLPKFEKGALKIAVYGGDFLVTDEIILNVHPSGYKEGIAPPYTPPDVYTQLTQEIYTKEQNIESIEDDVIKAASQVVNYYSVIEQQAADVNQAKNQVDNALNRVITISEDVETDKETVAVNTSDVEINKNIVIEKTAEVKEIYNTINETIKKYTVRFSGSSPAGTRLDSAVGMVANVAVNDAIVQNDFDSVPFFNRPICCCTWDKNKRKWRVNAYRGESNFKTDGSNGEVMYECTPFYYKADFSASGAPTYVSVTGTPCEGYMLAPMFKNAVDKVYCPSYWMSEVNGIAVSRSGTYPLYGSANEMMSKARTFDTKAYTETMEILFSDYLLLLVEFATKDFQSVMMGSTRLRYDKEDTITAVTPAGFVLPSSVASYYVTGQTICIGSTKNGTDKAENARILKIENSGDISYITLYEKVENIAVGDYISSRCYINGATDVIKASSGSVYSNQDSMHPCIWRGKVDPWGDGMTMISNVLIKREETGTEENPYTYTTYYLEDPYKYDNGSITEDYIKGNINVPSSDGYIKTLKTDSRYPFIMFPSELGANYNTYASAYLYSPKYAANPISAVRSGGNLTSGRTASIVSFSCGYPPGKSLPFFLGRLNISE